MVVATAATPHTTPPRSFSYIQFVLESDTQLSKGNTSPCILITTNGLTLPSPMISYHVVFLEEDAFCPIVETRPSETLSRAVVGKKTTYSSSYKSCVTKNFQPIPTRFLSNSVGSPKADARWSRCWLCAVKGKG